MTQSRFNEGIPGRHSVVCRKGSVDNFFLLTKDKFDLVGIFCLFVFFWGGGISNPKELYAFRFLGQILVCQYDRLHSFKPQRTLCFSFSRTDTGLSVWSFAQFELDHFSSAVVSTSVPVWCILLLRAWLFSFSLIHSRHFLIHSRHLLYTWVLSILLLWLFCTFESFSYQRLLMVSHWNLSDSKSPGRFW